MKKLQIAACATGFTAHVAFWAFQIGTNNHPLGWLCGEISCWVLIVADLPVSRLYHESNQSVTWGSLVLGSFWWALLAAGVANTFVFITLPLLRTIRHDLGTVFRTARTSFLVLLAWCAVTIASVVVAARAILPWFGYE